MKVVGLYCLLSNLPHPTLSRWPHHGMFCFVACHAFSDLSIHPSITHLMAQLLQPIMNCEQLKYPYHPLHAMTSCEDNIIYKNTNKMHFVPYKELLGSRRLVAVAQDSVMFDYTIWLSYFFAQHRHLKKKCHVRNAPHVELTPLSLLYDAFLHIAVYLMHSHLK